MNAARRNHVGTETNARPFSGGRPFRGRTTAKVFAGWTVVPPGVRAAIAATGSGRGVVDSPAPVAVLGFLTGS